MTLAELAAADQHEAREREFDRHAQRVAAYFLAVMLLVGLYATLAIVGALPAAPWSPLG